jgi:dolichyl-phosphate beta-glucosyltransferase
MLNKKISVVIPCFNEGRTIYQNIQEINRYLEKNIAAYEIIAVNDGSRDNTLEELQKIQKEVPLKIISHLQNEGKGKVVRDGILMSQNELVMFLDADLAIPIEELEKFLVEMDRGYDLVIASRFVPGLKVLCPVLWYRKIMEKVFRLLRMAILNNWKVQDTQCGFKVFRASVARKIFPMSTVKRFAFDAEIIFIAKKFGYSIKELPVILQNPERSHIRLFRDPVNMFFSLLEIRWNDLTRQYKWKQNA